jgi:isopenicillin N synthase-like dioxygenase
MITTSSIKGKLTLTDEEDLGEESSTDHIVIPDEPQQRKKRKLEDNMKQHHEHMEQQASIQTTMQVMTLKMMRRMCKEEGEETDPQDMSELRAEMQDFKNEMKSMGEMLKSLAETQTQIITLLKHLNYNSHNRDPQLVAFEKFFTS